MAYEELHTLAADTPAIYGDFAGNADLRSAVHHRFGRLAYSCAIGGTHVGQLRGAKDLPGPKASLFFAPAQIKKRRADGGAEALAQRLLQSWQAFLARVSEPQSPWLEVRRHDGPAALLATYRTVLAGHAGPRMGHILRPREADSAR